MEYEKMKTAITIMSSCDVFTITEDDKKMIVSVFGSIINSLRKTGLISTEISIEYEILKMSTFDNGYFCIVTRQMCALVNPVIRRCEKLFN